MNLEHCTILSLNITKYQAQPGKTHVKSRHYNSLSYRISGENTLNADGMTYKSDAGAVTFVPDYLPYTHERNSFTQGIAVHFVTKERIGSSIEIIEDISENNMENLFCELYRLWRIRPLENSLPCMSGFYNILNILAQRARSVDINVYRRFLEESMAFMYAQYRDSDFRVGQLHELARVSETYYRRVFRQVYGCSPIEFLKKLRIDCAKELLKSGCCTVTEVAGLSGFASPAYFSYSFKQMTGLNPVDYLRSEH